MPLVVIRLKKKKKKEERTATIHFLIASRSSHRSAVSTARKRFEGSLSSIVSLIVGRKKDTKRGQRGDDTRMNQKPDNYSESSTLFLFLWRRDALIKR